MSPCQQFSCDTLNLLACEKVVHESNIYLNLPRNTFKPNFVDFFVFSGTATLYLFLKFELLWLLLETATPSCFSRSLISDYPGCLLFREPIREHEKHYSLVRYMLMLFIPHMHREIAKLITLFMNHPQSSTI